MDRTGSETRVMPYRTLVRVWLVLLGLTGALVAAGTLLPPSLSVWAMLVITPVKAALIFYFFMHLKYEKPLLTGLVFVTLGLLVLVIGLLFSDLFYR
jgi:cytochrome c oxidase subunit 4